MWLKYYDSEFLKRKNPCVGIYDYMKAKTKNIQEYTALSYFGKKVLYGELYENIDYVSRALTSLGVKRTIEYKDKYLVCIIAKKRPN